jgi:hypothetical protein
MIPSGTLLYPNYKTDQAGYGITYPKVAWNIQARPIFVPNLPKTGALTVSLQYESSPGQWRTYETIYNIMMIREQAGQPYLEDGDPLFNSPSWSEPMPDFYVDTQGLSLKGAMLKDKIRITWPNGSFNIRDARIVLPADPRTMRLNLVAHHTGPSAFITGTNIFKDSAMDDPGVTTGPHFIGFGIGNYMYSINYNLGSSTYYTDRDFVKRGGDLLHAATSTDNLFNPMSDSSVRTNRPIMLNRPFRSVAELGYVFRDDPWKSLDFFAANSADAGLLDVFYIGNSGTGTPPDVIAGKVNLNSAARDALANGGESPVLSAIISQAARDYDFSISGTAKVNSALTDTAKINTLAKALAEFSGTAPLENISDITGIFEARASAFDSSDSKGQRETLIRALTGSVQTRTWNLLIDVIAQAGRFGSNAAGLDKFIVEGEKHYWLHVAIDRFTGEIVEQQLEPVAE